MLWIVFLGIGAAVLGVVVLLLGVLRESVKVLRTKVSGVWSAAVGVFVHTVIAGPSSTRRRSECRSFVSDRAARHPPVLAVVALLAVLVGYLRVVGEMVETIEETVVDKIAPGARHVAGHLSATATAASA